ncbi:uncharacterized protein BX664DRAFT_314627 [Halteromyces radiatus]|uniref:uncharacterized protein n=1 Tax=Halteromyces radiatus TaxID=101107 RepID=UPI002220AD5D|nr:uncharacterized protein BX664DRAFT_314627 [Halteromyces radiatus]KAI8089419.1 hypothetical protein BX664DRAFT_314627 [Halteromyces radiatus]
MLDSVRNVITLLTSDNNKMKNNHTEISDQCNPVVTNLPSKESSSGSTSSSITHDSILSVKSSNSIKDQYKILSLDHFRDIFTFNEKIITPNVALHQTFHRISSLCPVDQWFTINHLNLSRQNLTKLKNLSTILPGLKSLVLLTEIDGLINLINLQHLDICNNAISSFKGIESLIHLRILHAENNKVTSCIPFGFMHGLITLNLRSNRLQRLNFGDSTRLESLENLDVSYNRITILESIEALSHLKTLNLDHNEVQSLNLTKPMEYLKVLRICFNRISTFDGSFFPDLRTLYLDDNHISYFTNFNCISRLSDVSIRDQCDQPMDWHLQQLRGTRTLYLSGNHIHHIDTMVDFFGLEYLELCDAHMKKLPRDFAQQLPNLSVLNLSYNHLESIKPLRKLGYLQRLILVGNQMENVNDLVKHLQSLEKLQFLDLRENPVSCRYYSPLNGKNSSSNQTYRYIIEDHNEEWILKDMEHVRSLSLPWLQRRLTYRALFIKACIKLTRMDGILITDQDRTQVDYIISQHYQQHHSSISTTTNHQ